MINLFSDQMFAFSLFKNSFWLYKMLAIISKILMGFGLIRSAMVYYFATEGLMKLVKFDSERLQTLIPAVGFKLTNSTVPKSSALLNRPSIDGFSCTKWDIENDKISSSLC